MLKFHLLADKSQYLQQVASWNYEQWGFLRPEQTLADNVDLFSQRLNYQLPFTLLAFLDGIIVGMASVITDIYVLGFGDQPMLNNVYIAKGYRKQGFGKLLVREAERRAANLGFYSLFLFVKVQSLVEFYELLGWKFIRRIRFLEKHDMSIMEKTPLYGNVRT